LQHQMAVGVFFVPIPIRIIDIARKAVFARQNRRHQTVVRSFFMFFSAKTIMPNDRLLWLSFGKVVLFLNICNTIFK
jgi:hypothetical protein